MRQVRRVARGHRDVDRLAVVGVGDLAVGERRLRGRRDAVDLMTERALGDEERLAGDGEGVRRVWLLGHRGHLFDPRVVVLSGECLDLHAHEAVREPAVLGALALVQADLAGLHHPLVGPARHGVHLAGERGDPEAVDHVVGLDPETDVAVDRDGRLGGGDDVGSAVVVEVVSVLPPPLLPDHGDVDRVLGIIHAQDRVDVEHGEHGE